VNLNVPRVGNLQFMAEDFTRRCGLGYVETPEYSERTIEIGVSLSPEHLCFPMKILVGSAIEALEKGADTLLTVAGYGPCRFNYFAEIQKRILEREGYRFRMITFDTPLDAPLEFYRNIRALLNGSRFGVLRLPRYAYITLAKTRICDEIDREAMALRALELQEGSVDLAVEECRAMLGQADTGAEIEEAHRAVQQRLSAVQVDRSRPHIRVGVVGEMLEIMEPYFNYDIERWLARRGAVVERSLFISDIFTPRGRNPVLGFDQDDIDREAAPYVNNEVGGHGQTTVAAAASYARRGFDAAVHLFPFTCMPEVIARTVFTRMSGDLGMPILSMSHDEHTGRAGVQTRLEALVDLAWSRHEKHVAVSGGCY